MIADGLTKALQRHKFENFVKMIGIVDIRERLKAEKRAEVLREELLSRKRETDLEIVMYMTH